MESLPGVRSTAAGPAVTAQLGPPPADHAPRGTSLAGTLRFPAGDRVIVSGLPGSGKTTLIRRAVPVRGTVSRVDSQEVRERWERRLPTWLPYALYRPLVRVAHYAGLRGALASGGSVVVHDCGARSWVRRWVAADSRRRGRATHLLLLDVPAATALAGQAERGRGVSRYAFARHQRAMGRLLAAVEAGRLPDGCASAVLLDREKAGSLRALAFERPR